MWSERAWHAIEVRAQRVGAAIDRSKILLYDARLSGLAHRSDFSSVEGFLESLSPEDPKDGEVGAALLSKASSFRPLPNEVVARILDIHEQRSGQGEMLRIVCLGGGDFREVVSYAIGLDVLSPAIKTPRVFESWDIQPTIWQTRLDTGFSTAEVQVGLPARDLASYFTLREGSWFLREPRRFDIRSVSANLLDGLGVRKVDVFVCVGLFETMTEVGAMRVTELIRSAAAAGSMLVTDGWRAKVSERVISCSRGLVVVDGFTDMPVISV